MTGCTRHRCINHFIFCTHHQWLTQLSCLSAEFSPNTIHRYAEYCSRSLLAKAQLAQWIEHVSGRNWLVHVGDTAGLQSLSPRSLTKGFKSVGVSARAPRCLKELTIESEERLENVMGSCTFTSTTLHMGNADRPWEYSTSKRSMVTLSFDTVGYDITKGRVPPGEYFDVHCFCSNFAVDQRYEPCSDHLDRTKERLWLNAICGPTSLPSDWDKSLTTLGPDYIPTYKWGYSTNFADIPQKVTEFSKQCTTDACDIDTQGFCEVKPAVDRTCICGRIDYNLCQGSCQIFESRKRYVEWLHELCDDVEGWHGLPDNWQQLLIPRPRDIVPWHWTVRPESSHDAECPSSRLKLSSIAFANLVTLFAVYIGERASTNTKFLEPKPKSPVWILRGIVLACVRFVGNCVIINIIQSTPGYEGVPRLQLMVLLFSLLRLAWVAIAPAQISDPESKDLLAASSALYSEILLQIPNLYYMTTTVNYGRLHGFYLGVLPDTVIGHYAWIMYGGALLWVVLVALTAIPIIRVLRVAFATDIPPHRSDEDLSRCDNNKCTGAYSDAEMYDELLPESHSCNQPKRSHYGTMPEMGRSTQPSEVPREFHQQLYVVLTLSLPIMFLVQWLFWIGFINVSGDE